MITNDDFFFKPDDYDEIVHGETRFVIVEKTEETESKRQFNRIVKDIKNKDDK